MSLSIHRMCLQESLSKFHFLFFKSHGCQQFSVTFYFIRGSAAVVYMFMLVKINLVIK